MGEYIGREVLDHDGARVGIITDLRCVQDVPVRGRSAMLGIDDALVSSRCTGATHGYDRRGGYVSAVDSGVLVSQYRLGARQDRVQHARGGGNVVLG